MNLKCPECSEACDRDAVDVGVGVIYGPWGCNTCGWSEDPKYNHPTAESGFDPQGGYDSVVAAVARGALPLPPFRRTPTCVFLRPQPAPSFVDVIGKRESRIWLAYEVEHDVETDTWHAEFESCGTDPTADAWRAQCDAKMAARNVEIERERARLDAERANLEPPKLGHWISPALIEFDYPGRTWVDWLLEGSGWEDILSHGVDTVNEWPGDTHDEGPLDFLLRKGIAPGQPFLVRFFGHRGWGPDHNGEYDEEWSCEIVAVGPLPLGGALAAIERAWAYNERTTQETP